MEITKRRGRPPKPPTPSLRFDKVLKIRDAVIQAARNVPDEVKLRLEEPLPFTNVVEELSCAIGRFFAAGYEMRDGVELIQSLELDLSDSEIKNILLQSLQCESD